jgi:hypothetical protein
MVCMVASGAVIVWVAVAGGQSSVLDNAALHDSHYMIRHSRLIIWPMLLVMALSCAVGIAGYWQTDHFIRRTLGSSIRLERPMD